MFKLVKAKDLGQKSKAMKAGQTTDFILVDNQDDTCTVVGTDAAGNPSSMDLSTVADLTVSSSDTSIITVDAPTGAKFAMHATGKLSTPGTPVVLTVVVTWKDGSVGPFETSLPCDVVAGAISGVQIIPGTPVSR